MTKYAPHTMTEAYGRARAKVGHSTKDGKVGRCLAECVNPANTSPYSIPAPWGWGGNGEPWAINFWLNAVAHGKVVKTSNPAKIPAGALAFMVNNADKGKAKPAGAGHVFIGAGHGYAYSTDRPTNGKWGKVTIRSIEADWRKTLVGYIERTGDGYTLTDKPAPEPDFEKWWNGLGWNTAASDRVHGKASWDERLPGLITALEAYDKDVYQLVEFETEGAQGRTAAAALKMIGYKVAVADNQRAIVVRENIKVGRTKVITLDEKGPADDDKQIVLAEIWPSGPNAVIVECGHFEYRDGRAYDKVRVKQGHQTKIETLRFANHCDVPYTRVVFYNDENSFSQVSTKAFGVNWQDIGERTTYTRALLSTLISWAGKKTSSGYRPDKVRVWRRRPALAVTSIAHVNDGLSDHLAVGYTFGKM